MNCVFSIIGGILIILLHIFLFIKVKNVLIRLLPTLILFIMTVLWFIMMSLSKGWDILGYFVLGVNTALVLILCLLCWAVFGIIKLIKLKKKSANL